MDHLWLAHHPDTKGANQPADGSMHAKESTKTDEKPASKFRQSISSKWIIGPASQTTIGDSVNAMESPFDVRLHLIRNQIGTMGFQETAQRLQRTFGRADNPTLAYQPLQFFGKSIGTLNAQSFHSIRMLPLKRAGFNGIQERRGGFPGNRICPQ